MIASEWPFQESPDLEVVTTVKAIEENKILFVIHGEERGNWQFHNGEYANLEDIAIASLQEVVDLDPSIKQLATLPPGWLAMRKHPENHWRCYRSDRLDKLGGDPIQVHCICD